MPWRNRPTDTPPIGRSISCRRLGSAIEEMAVKTHVKQISSYSTKDGSGIQELVHPSKVPVKNQSLALATIPVGVTTLLHRHKVTEEIYHITQGSGIMTLGSERLRVVVGDSILIPPGTPHCIENNGVDDLLIICACAPAYSHEDTELL